MVNVSLDHWLDSICQMSAPGYLWSSFHAVFAEGQSLRASWTSGEGSWASPPQGLSVCINDFLLQERLVFPPRFICSVISSYRCALRYLFYSLDCDPILFRFVVQTAPALVTGSSLSQFGISLLDTPLPPSMQAFCFLFERSQIVTNVKWLW